MSTRGAYGFRLNGVDRLAYNHCDSYPTGLGLSIIAQLRTLLENGSLANLKKKVEKLKMVRETVKPTTAEIKKLKKFANIKVGEQSMDTWYCLLRNIQGDIEKSLEVGYMLESNRFVYDSMFCEWAYIIDMDTASLEIYKGSVKEQGTGRYDSKKEKGEEYWGVALVDTFSFKDVLKGNIKLPNCD